MRCLSLAHMLKQEEGARVSFVCSREIPDQLKQKIIDSGCSIRYLSSDLNMNQDRDAEQFLEAINKVRVDWIIVDHYCLDIRWESRVRPYTNGLIVIDDLANRVHDCDIILDQNLYPNLENRYRQLIPEHCTQFLGPTYSLIRQEFYEYKNRLRVRERCNSILVNFGGSDPTNEISKVLTAIEGNLDEFNKMIKFYIVAGSANQRQEEIQERCKGLTNVIFYPHYEQMAELLSEVDLVIGAGGISLWERCFLGVPSMIIAIAHNQIDVVREAEERDLIWNIGYSSNVTPYKIAEILKQILSNPSILTRKSKNSIECMELLRNRDMHPILPLIKKGR